MRAHESLRVVAIIQARMESSRLPNKVLLDICGQPMLARVIGRARQAKSLAAVTVATPADTNEEPIARLCAQMGVPCSRGSLYDVLERYHQAALEFKADVIVRLTADCPLLDPELMDDTVAALMGKPGLTGQWSPAYPDAPVPPPSRRGIPWDFAANRLPPPFHRTYPIGLDVEACTFEALDRAWREAKEAHEREHVFPYLYEAPGRFRCRVGNHAMDYGSLRWTVDTAEDLDLVRTIYQAFSGREDFSWQEVLRQFEAHPEWSGINAGIPHKTFYDVDSRRGEI